MKDEGYGSQPGASPFTYNVDVCVPLLWEQISMRQPTFPEPSEFQDNVYRIIKGL